MQKLILSFFLTLVITGCNKAQTNTLKTSEVYQSPTSTLEIVQENVSDNLKIALVLPLSGKDAKVGKNLFDAIQLAILDLRSNDLRVSVIDSNLGYEATTKRLNEEQPQIILGPVFAEEAIAINKYARQNNLCILTFSNDHNLAGNGCLMALGILPETSVIRTIEYANSKGLKNIKIALPNNKYGKIVESHTKKLAETLLTNDAGLQKSEISKLSSSDALSAPEAGTMLNYIVSSLPKDHRIKLLGGAAWDDEKIIQDPRFNGSWFAATPLDKKKIFEQRFRNNYGYKPLKIAALGYDSITLISEINKNAKITKQDFMASEGFLGITGVFRFKDSGLTERLLPVYEIRNGQAVEIDKAKEEF